jgi:CheY-like chemotaxis protein/anti-sigma regulatory factor (Ser/Thr protein kinase)
LQSPRILFVDADPAVHDALSGALGRNHRQLESAYDGREGLDFLRQGTFEVVFAGQGRNGLNGAAFLRRARQICPEARIIVTGDSDPAQALGALRNHAYGYLHKPLPLNSVTEMAQRAMEASSWKDDIRVLSARPQWIGLDVRAKLDAAERTICFVRELEADLAPHKRDDVVTAFRELLMNAVEHGAKSDRAKHVRVSLVRTSRALIVQIQDPGPGFSLDVLPHAAISNPEDAPIRHVEVRAEQGQRPGGFGILMARNLVDDLVYNERGNSVLFVKDL